MSATQQHEQVQPIAEDPRGEPIRQIDFVISERISDATGWTFSRHSNLVVHASQAANQPWTARVEYPHLRHFKAFAKEREMPAWMLAIFTPYFEALTNYPSGVPGKIKPAPDQAGRWDPADDPANKRRRNRSERPSTEAG